ncbi:hypothetical protein A3Q56_02569 [Intoshia linei]|uniref:Protein phosphatase inhibitor 2 n=1 Tax=Intoshia linei TaxID=1819745 RepID=A0A177B8F9_9BILA|nr:hypothetical protein A3Q56_02569 [Intoshia linei]
MQNQRKSILRNSQSSGTSKKSMKWDEQNILETYHPIDKDYGHMKITEPKTPYNELISDDEDEPNLSTKLNQAELTLKFSSIGFAEPSKAISSHEDRSNFVKKRSQHYDEFRVMKQLREKNLDRLSEINKDFKNSTFNEDSTEKDDENK